MLEQTLKVSVHSDNSRILCVDYLMLKFILIFGRYPVTSQHCFQQLPRVDSQYTGAFDSCIGTRQT